MYSFLKMNTIMYNVYQSLLISLFLSLSLHLSLCISLSFSSFFSMYLLFLNLCIYFCHSFSLLLSLSNFFLCPSLYLWETRYLSPSTSNPSMPPTIHSFLLNAEVNNCLCSVYISQVLMAPFIFGRLRLAFLREKSSQVLTA